MATSKNATLRKARYRQLRELGFSRKEATKLRDRKGERIERSIRGKETYLRRVPDTLRTEKQQSDYQRIGEYRKQKQSDQRLIRESREERLANFANWSSKHIGFPDSILAEIVQYNEDAGELEFAAYGFRKFYHKYVNGKTDKQAEALVERRDT